MGALNIFSTITTIAGGYTGGAGGCGLSLEQYGGVAGGVAWSPAPAPGKVETYADHGHTSYHVPIPLVDPGTSHPYTQRWVSTHIYAYLRISIALLSTLLSSFTFSAGKEKQFPLGIGAFISILNS